MKIVKDPNSRNIMIDDAHICNKNFSGTKWGDREDSKSFCLVVPDQESLEKLTSYGFNVTIKTPRNPGDSPYMYLPIKVKIEDREVTGFDGTTKIIPSLTAKLISGSDRLTLTHRNIGMLDEIIIDHVNMDIRLGHWRSRDGREGDAAYLQGMHVYQRVDRFAIDEYPEE